MLPITPIRPLGVTRARQTVQKLTGRRREAKEARAYAECWYQAIRAWKVRTVQLPSPGDGRYQPDDLDFLTLGMGGPITATYLQTPIGDCTEHEVATVIKELLGSGVPDHRAIGQLLDRLRGTYRTPVTLLRECGRWQPDMARHAAYAVAVLTLAVRLGDGHAEAPLARARADQQGRVAEKVGTE
ncbi:hypothetical protein SAMN00790413_01920 [Deinococcus hopiensis KR-140]|uniref:Uncharacterized protein n=1 Tax=Deinococcus hopiensis KR-140 TaxID=695939 RepID=A0A1W1VIV2_9DEIO|nr:hypothetical protein SAMN00790413_01920 [Deinococcus hopiensis KR-140]